MFQVWCTFPLDEEWEEKDARVKEVAGLRADYSSAKSTKGAGGERRFGWLIKEFEQAQGLKYRLGLIEGVSVSFREHNSCR